MLNNLIQWEKDNGFKAKYVAKKLGLTDSQYSKIKLGKQKPTIEVAERLEREFAVEDALILLKPDERGLNDERKVL